MVGITVGGAHPRSLTSWEAEARRRGAFVEDALTEADALAAGDQEGMKA